MDVPIRNALDDASKSAHVAFLGLNVPRSVTRSPMNVNVRPSLPSGWSIARHTRRRRVAHRAARSSLKRDKSFSMGQKMKQMRFERDASVALARGDGGSLETCVRGWRDAMVP